MSDGAESVATFESGQPAEGEGLRDRGKEEGVTVGENTPDAPPPRNPAQENVTTQESVTHERQETSLTDLSSQSQKAELPDWVQDKFKRTENPIEEQARAYDAAQRKLMSKTEDLRKEVRTELEAEFAKMVGAPEDASQYTLPDGLAANEDHLNAFREKSKELGLSPHQFAGIASLYNEIAGQGHVDIDAETQKLGPNAQKRIDSLSAWGAKHIPEQYHAAAERAMQTAEGFEMFEHIMNTMMKSGMLPDEEGGSEGGEGYSTDGLRKLQRDPRYADPKQREPDFVKKVEEYALKLAERRAAGSLA